MSQNYQIFKEWPLHHEYDQHDLSIFLQETYWAIHLHREKTFPITIRNDAGDLVLFCCFALHNQTWKSPFFAPHSAYFCNSLQDEIILNRLVIAFLKKIGNYPIEIKLPPLSELQAKLNNTYKISLVELNHILPVQKQSNLKLHIREKEKVRKLKGLRKKNLKFSIIPAHEYENSYITLMQWRKSKGHENQIPLHTIIKLKENFMQQYYFIRLEDDHDLVALAIVIRENSVSLYTYIVMSNPYHSSEEFTLLMWDKIYDLAKDLKVQYIDMGTSMLHHTINKGLASYKSAIGGNLCRKYSITNPC